MQGLLSALLVWSNKEVDWSSMAGYQEQKRVGEEMGARHPDKLAEMAKWMLESETGAPNFASSLSCLFLWRSFLSQNIGKSCLDVLGN